jgi:rhodanese-related sulfurtransferase
MQELILFISNHPMLSIATGTILLLVLLVELMRSRKNSFSISPLQAIQLINHNNAVVIDIRQNDVFRKGHIIDAQSMTWQEIRDNAKKLEKWKNKPIIIFCSTGLESQKVAALLLKQGYNAHSLAGGMRAWLEAQMPLVKE